MIIWLISLSALNTKGQVPYDLLDTCFLQLTLWDTVTPDNHKETENKSVYIFWTQCYEMAVNYANTSMHFDKITPDTKR